MAEVSWLVLFKFSKLGSGPHVKFIHFQTASRHSESARGRAKEHRAAALPKLLGLHYRLNRDLRGPALIVPHLSGFTQLFLARSSEQAGCD